MDLSSLKYRDWVEFGRTEQRRMVLPYDSSSPSTRSFIVIPAPNRHPGEGRLVLSVREGDLISFVETPIPFAPCTSLRVCDRTCGRVLIYYSGRTAKGFCPTWLSHFRAGGLVLNASEGIPGADREVCRPPTNYCYLIKTSEYWLNCRVCPVTVCLEVG